MCAYQIGEHLHLTFSDHLDLYSQQANPNFRFPSEQIPLVFWINNVPRLEYDTTDSIIFKMYLTLSLTAFLVKGEKKKFKENIHAFSVQGKSHSVSVLQKKTFKKTKLVRFFK
jgi:hypothetical protein